MRTRLPERNLDVLRTLAVALVVGFHLSVTAHHDSDLVSNVARGGVILFFVHTSLVLMASLERGGQADGWVRRFYVRRAFRLYPLAWATIAIVVLAKIPSWVPQAGDLRTYTAPSAWELVGNLALLQNVLNVRVLSSPLWSLPVEVEMYVVLPLCFLLARRSLRNALALVGIALLGGVVSNADVVPGLWRLSVVAFAPCFTAGVLAYAILHHWPHRRLLPAWTLAPLLVFPIVLLMLPGATAHIIPLGWAVALPIGAGLPFVDELHASWLTRHAKTIATYSYGIYLLHCPCAWLAFVALRMEPLAVQLAVYVAAMVLLPWGAFHLIESPLIEIGKRATHGRASDAAAVPAP